MNALPPIGIARLLGELAEAVRDLRGALTERGRDRRAERLSVSPAAILTVRHAAELLPMADREAERWIRDSGLVRDLRGRDVVKWGDVLDALPESPREADPDRGSPRRRRQTFARGGGL